MQRLNLWKRNAAWLAIPALFAATSNAGWADISGVTIQGVEIIGTTSPKTITIFGQGFTPLTKNDRIRVFLGERNPNNEISALCLKPAPTATVIQCNFETLPAAGDYRLVVSVKDTEVYTELSKTTDRFDLTIGDINSTGPKGDTGAKGPRGPQGTKGDTGGIGLTGAQGPKGDAGSIGATGAQGPKGDAGSVGLTGPQGLKGDAGSIGATGLQGASGPKGDKGDTGLQGPAGPVGSSGGSGASVAAFTQQSSQLVNSLTQKTLASLTLSPKSDGSYLIFAKGQFELKSENEYVTVYCQVKSQRTDIVPVGSEAQLDYVEMRLYYIGAARGVTVPQSVVLNGVQQVTAGST